jgi:dipeptidyl aminopeptidase/acylaminoacyl peptidase
VDGAQEVRLTSGPCHDLLLDWYGDGILFQSTRGGTPGVWHLPIEQGRAAGPPSLLRADTWGHSPIGVAGDAYVFGVVAERPTLYTAAVDLAASQLTSTPTALEDPYGGRSNFGWDWSPDGRSIAHVVRTSGARPQLIIRSRAGEEVRRIRLELRSAARIRWADDGATVFVSGSDLAGQNGIHRVEIESGSLETVLGSGDLTQPVYGTEFDVSPDGRTIYLNTQAGENAPIHLVAFDLRNREERRLARQGHRGTVARSPDGSRLAIANQNSEGVRNINVMTIDGGRLEPVYDLSPPPGRQGYVDVWSIDWTPDGESLVVRLLGPGGGLLQIPLDGAEPRHVEGIDQLYWRPVRLSPDGRQLIYMAGRTRGEIWVMENITEAAAAGSPGTR